jgi:hypothetical protein
VFFPVCGTGMNWLEDVESEPKHLPSFALKAELCEVLHVNGDGPEADSCYRAVSIRVDGTHQF